ncbi:MAG: hypothetical protein IPK59_20220 [Rhodospirillaceae bacterium]|nr:hypothetical protein [Rhodospirillaceae bacterium]
MDSTGIAALGSIRGDLPRRRLAFGNADVNSEAKHIVERAGLQDWLGQQMLLPSAEAAVAGFEAVGLSDTSKKSG